MKSARIKSFSGPYYPAFGLNTETYYVNLRIQSEWRDMQTRKTPNTDTFYVALRMTAFVFNNNVVQKLIGLRITSEPFFVYVNFSRRT